MRTVTVTTPRGVPGIMILLTPGDIERIALTLEEQLRGASKVATWENPSGTQAFSLCLESAFVEEHGEYYEEKPPCFCGSNCPCQGEGRN